MTTTDIGLPRSQNLELRIESPDSFDVREFAGDDDFGVGRRLRETRRQIVDSLGEEDPS